MTVLLLSTPHAAQRVNGDAHPGLMCALQRNNKTSTRTGRVRAKYIDVNCVEVGLPLVAQVSLPKSCISAPATEQSGGPQLGYALHEPILMNKRYYCYKQPACYFARSTRGFEWAASNSLYRASHDVCVGNTNDLNGSLPPRWLYCTAALNWHAVLHYRTDKLHCCGACVPHQPFCVAHGKSSSPCPAAQGTPSHMQRAGLPCSALGCTPKTLCRC